MQLLHLVNIQDDEVFQRRTDLSGAIDAMDHMFLFNLSNEQDVENLQLWTQANIQRDLNDVRQDVTNLAVDTVVSSFVLLPAMPFDLLSHTRHEVQQHLLRS